MTYAKKTMILDHQKPSKRKFLGKKGHDKKSGVIIAIATREKQPKKSLFDNVIILSSEEDKKRQKTPKTIIYIDLHYT